MKCHMLEIHPGKSHGHSDKKYDRELSFKFQDRAACNRNVTELDANRLFHGKLTEKPLRLAVWGCNETRVPTPTCG